MTGHPRTAHVLSFTAAFALLTGCTSGGPPAVRRDPAVPALRLVAFDNCADLLSGLRAAARESVGPYGLPGDHPLEYAVGGDAKAAAGAARGNSAVDSVQALPAAPGYSATNTHEAGVDEPDLVKTDGRRIVTVSGGTLRVVDAASRRVTGSLALGQDGAEADLLLAGDHALVLARGAAQPGAAIGARPGAPIGTRPGAPVGVLPGAPVGVLPGTPVGVLPGEPDPSAPATGSRLLLVDLAGTPRVLGRYTIDGSLVDARQTGTAARVVVRSGPHLPFRLDGDRPQEQRLADNRSVIDAAPVDRWLPAYTVESGGQRSTGRVDCHAVSRPSTYSGASLLTVLTFDLAGATLGAGDPTSLVADGDTVYANGPSLYVATDQRWHAQAMLRGVRADPRNVQTEVYKFDVSGAGRPRYVAGGTIPGWLINQYAMSEWNGQLRVATTLGQAESSVYMLSGSLKQVGHLGGLGKGERIYAVRFVGPTGYVVTFRQTDPLYVVDLRDAGQPRVTGELKINGYSAYLHPAGDGRLIGVGQDADSGGRRKGMQVSLFNVADPTRPTRVAQYAVPGGYTEAEFDPHAFLYRPATGLLVVPVVTPDDPVRGAGLAGALALRLSADSIAPLGTVTGWRGEQIRRSLVIGDVLWTVSDTSLSAHDAGSLATLTDVPLTP